MNITKETSRVLFDLTNMESSTGIDSVSNNTSRERTGQTTDTLSDITLTRRVWERKSRRSRLAFSRFVDMGGSLGRGLVFTLEVEQCDVVADGVLDAVDTEGIDTACAGKTSSGGCAIHNLVRSGEDLVSGCEVERRL